MVGVVADASVHGINCMHHQTDCHLVLLLLSKTYKKKVLGATLGGQPFFKWGEQIMYKRTPQYVFNAIFRAFPLAEQTNATYSALVPRLCVPPMEKLSDFEK